MMYIYRWYKILSPHIDIQIDSVGMHSIPLSQNPDWEIQRILKFHLTAFDKHAMLLYVSLHQIFSIQFLPFHKSHVSLTTVLHLTKLNTFPAPTSQHEVKASQRTDGRAKYYITSQNDLYQTSEFVKFVFPWFGLGTVGVMLWQFVATIFCIMGAVLGWPISWLEENVFGGNRERRIRDIVGAE